MEDVDTRYWTMQDVNFNIMGLLDSTGDLVERYEYSSHGKRQVFSYAGNGTNDPLCLTARGIAPRVLDGPFVDDGTGLVQPYSINPFGHQGLYHDEHLGPDAIQNRARYRRSFGFLQRDPYPGTYYPDGMNTYAPHHVMHQGVDPWGQRANETVTSDEDDRYMLPTELTPLEEDCTAIGKCNRGKYRARIIGAYDWADNDKLGGNLGQTKGYRVAINIKLKGKCCLTACIAAGELQHLINVTDAYRAIIEPEPPEKKAEQGSDGLCI